MHLPPPLIAVLFIIAMLIFGWIMPGLEIAIPGQKWLAVILLLAGVLCIFMAGGRFFRAKTTIMPNKIEESSALVTEGIYQYSRNPMYLGMALAIAGAGIGGGSLLTPLAVAGFVLVINKVQIEKEEEGLVEIFGDGYREYCSKVRRWI